MPLWISQSYFRIVLEEQSCRNSFQYLQCISRAHAQFYPDDAMHMLWLDIQFQNFYFVHCSRPSDTGSYQILLLFLAKHFVPVFCAPFKVPHRYSDAVAPPFILFRIALANQNLYFHFTSARSALSHSTKFIYERKLPLQMLFREQQLALPVLYLF